LLSSVTDYTPVDYFVWHIAELNVYQGPKNNSSSPVHKMQEIQDSLDKDNVVRACKRFMSRIEALVETIEDLIE
jgi:hypothetical protein